jgi:hypothetical protein
MNNLADTYSDLGRHQDALVMGEKTLEFRRRVLPENHPDIGATWFCGLLIDVEVDFLCSRRHNDQSGQDVLIPWAEPRCSCDEGEDA